MGATSLGVECSALACSQIRHQDAAGGRPTLGRSIHEDFQHGVSIDLRVIFPVGPTKLWFPRVREVPPDVR